MKVYFIGAGPGASDLITLRGINILKKAEICIYAGSLVSTDHLKDLPSNAEIFNSAQMDLKQICEIFLYAFLNNKDVARLHTGDPSIYGAIGEQISFCLDNNIECEIIPGVSRFTACAAALKKELTLPGVSQTVILTRLEGRTPMPKRERLELLAQSRTSMCIFLSVGMIEKIVESLLTHYPEDTPVAVISRVSWPDQKILKSDLKNISSMVKKEHIHKTSIILVGDFLTEKGDLSRLYDAGFTHQFREGASDAE